MGVKSNLLIGISVILNVYGQYNSGFNQQQQNGRRNRFQLSGSCPEPNGTFPTSTCDGYIECVNGVPENKNCPDGLLFNGKLGPFAFPCQYPIDVDCTGREQTQPSQATDDCPHQFGYYKVGDERNCGQFKNCVDGRAFIFDCPEGLAWNSETYRCDWPDQVSDCDAEAYLGFSCPATPKLFGEIPPTGYRFYKSPHDCQRYFICIEDKPRLYNCGDGSAFNDITNTCDDPENVTGCALPQYQELKGGIKNLASSNQYAINKYYNSL